MEPTTAIAITDSLEQELNPWLAAEARFDQAANRLGLDEGLAKVLRTSQKELTVHGHAG